MHISRENKQQWAASVNYDTMIWRQRQTKRERNRKENIVTETAARPHIDTEDL